jgi:hypothetical protein
MRSNLSPTPHGDVVQRPLTFIETKSTSAQGSQKTRAVGEPWPFRSELPGLGNRLPSRQVPFRLGHPSGKRWGQAGDFLTRSSPPGSPRCPTGSVLPPRLGCRSPLSNTPKGKPYPESPPAALLLRSRTFPLTALRIIPSGRLRLAPYSILSAGNLDYPTRDPTRWRLGSEKIAGKVSSPNYPSFAPMQISPRRGIAHRNKHCTTTIHLEAS